MPKSVKFKLSVLRKLQKKKVMDGKKTEGWKGKTEGWKGKTGGWKGKTGEWR